MCKNVCSYEPKISGCSCHAEDQTGLKLLDRMTTFSARAPLARRHVLDVASGPCSIARGRVSISR
jgi:hypothetical protein